MSKRLRVPRPQTEPPGDPFPSAAEAWFWCVQCLKARADGARFVAGMALERRPCDPDDVLSGVERLFRRGRLTRHHLSVLWDYGVQNMPPDGRDRKQARAARLWDEAFDLLTSLWRPKGIVR